MVKQELALSVNYFRQLGHLKARFRFQHLTKPTHWEVSILIALKLA